MPRSTPGSDAVQGDPLPGMTLGDYVVEARVAAGGMGIVYRARHEVLRRKVAVKVLRPEYAEDEEQRERFLREARVIGSIKHRGIVGVENFGALPDGHLYMVMEYLEGESLDAALERETQLPLGRALEICDEVLDALEAVTERGELSRIIASADDAEACRWALAAIDAWANAE